MTIPEYTPPDYTTMSYAALYAALKDDGAKWAEAFCQHAKKLGHTLDEGWVIGWFANAIENSWTCRTRFF